MRDLEEIKQNPRCCWKGQTEDGMAGYIALPEWQGSVVMSTGAGWEHVSVAPAKKRITPSWDDMCIVKKIFWKDDEAVIQIHPAEDEYVNNMPNCLHLWRCSYKEMVLPPRILVGIKEGMTKSEIDEEVKRAYETSGEKYDNGQD
jgi:hypothetical protein